MDKKTDIILVTDPGVDDATSLLYAVFSNQINIKLVCVAGGNSPIEITTRNALYLTELFKLNAPVAVGHSLRGEKEVYARAVHGKGGLGGVKVNPKKLKTKPIETPACEAMYETLKANKGKMTIVIIGPMTSVAEMIEKHKDCKKYIKEIIFMGGSKEKIYGAPYREFNISFDPDAVDIVLKSGISLVMVPMELGHFAYLGKDDIKKIKKIGKVGKIFAKMYKKYKDFHVGNYGVAVHDVCAIYYLTHKENMKTENGFVELKRYTENGFDYGYIETTYGEKQNVTVCVDMDILKFKYDLFDAFEEAKRVLEK